MKTAIFITAIALALGLFAGNTFAATICLQDNFGAFWQLKGGKVDKKSYTLLRISGDLSCAEPGSADITMKTSTTLVLGAFTTHDSTGSGVCFPILWSADLNLSFAGSGTYDGLGDGTIQGPFTLTPINCSSFPTAKKQEINHD
jgi:hypothetical protein